MSVQCWAFEFLTANGAHPLGGLVGIPQPHFLAAGRETSTASGLASVSIQTDYSNIFAGGFRDGEFLLLDGETARHTVALVYRYNHCFQIAADFKQVNHRMGSLDNAIEKWHEFFQLPDAQRDQSERDRLLFIYESDGVSLTLDAPTRSLGDTTVQFAYHSDCGIGGTKLPGALWFAGVNLPSGSLEELSGSGEPALFFGLQSHGFAWGPQFTLGSRLGVLVPQQAEGLPGVSSLLAFGNIGLHWHPQWLAQRDIRLALQLDVHSPIYKSTLRELGNYTVQLAMGGTWNPSPSHEFSAAFLEDVAIDTTPDLVLHLQYRFTF